MADGAAVRRPGAGAPARFIKLPWGVLATALAVLYTAALAPTAAFFARIGRHRAASAVTRLWGRLIVRTCGIRVEVEGLEHLRGLKSYVLVANHQSFFDIFAVAARLPGDTRFVAKKELLKVPLVGRAMERNGHIIVDRERGGKAIRRALAAARDNYPVCVFAEGRRFNDGRVHEFSDGAAWLAITAGLPCFPMAICGSGAILPRGAKVAIPGGRMKLKILPAIPAEGLKSADRAALTRGLQAAVSAAFEP